MQGAGLGTTFHSQRQTLYVKFEESSAIRCVYALYTCTVSGPRGPTTVWLVYVNASRVV